jgi:hypothetical protein
MSDRDLWVAVAPNCDGRELDLQIRRGDRQLFPLLSDIGEISFLG